MQKDLKSYLAHDKDFHSESNNLATTKKIVAEYEKNETARRVGFLLALQLTSSLPKTHIDVGSGNGWLLKALNQHFERSIGIEPSSKGIDVAKDTTRDCVNVSFINDDMVNAFEKMNLEGPVFVTTATVLNHIENYYVAHFLRTLSALPPGSVLFFDERYDENIDWDMWHVRSKDWWRTHLNEWQVIFLDIDVAGYPSGIYATKVRSDSKLPTIEMGTAAKTSWFLNKIYNMIRRIVIKIIP